MTSYYLPDPDAVDESGEPRVERRSLRKSSRRSTNRPDETAPTKKADRRSRSGEQTDAGPGIGPMLNGRPIMDLSEQEPERSGGRAGDSLDQFSREERQVFHRNVMIVRQGALLLLIGVVFALAARSVEHQKLLIGLGALWVVGGLYQLTRIRLRGELPATLPWLDCIANLAMLAIAPKALPVILVLGFAQLTLAVIAYSTMHAFFAATCLVVGVPFISFVRGDADAISVAAVAAFGLFVPVIALVSHRVQKLEEITRRRYLDLMGGFDAVVWEADPKTLELRIVGPQAMTVFGLDPAEFALRYKELIHPDDQELEEALRRGGIESGDNRFAVEYRMMDRTGDMISVRNTIAVERDASGVPIRVRGVITDVTRQQEAEATIRKQAQYDTLTGLPNRSLFNEQLRRRLEDMRRTGDELAVLILDLNGFKEVNDTLGHAVGDQLLQAIAGRLAAYMPERSTVARLGGDEFAVVLSPATARAAASIAETIASCLQPPITVDDMTIQAGASTGIALYPSDGETPAALMRRADAAMYEAKQSGRTHMFATPDDDQANVRRLQLLGELRASITTGDFRLFHQPKVDLKTGRIVGTEGLIRWNHRQFGLLSPSEFVELSELSGLIQPLTRWVLERGIRDLSEWRAKGFELTVALNLSVRNFFDQTLPTYIAQLLSKYNVPGDQLCLEITESEVMADRALARTALSAFRALGVKIAIDDFGTGFSSLSQLQQLPIDEIKVDQSFVSGMIDNPQDAVIVRSIIDLAHNLGLEIVAEGAEDEFQLAALRSLGADRAQGYVIARPLPPEEFIPWLEAMERGETPSPLGRATSKAAKTPAGVSKLKTFLQPELLTAESASTAPIPALATPVNAGPIGTLVAVAPLAAEFEAEVRVPVAATTPVAAMTLVEQPVVEQPLVETTKVSDFLGFGSEEEFPESWKALLRAKS
jgi:diguanylate cyclase (GGDEF)-like protein